MVNTNFEHSALEADIQKLSREISQKRNLPENKDFSDKELIKQSIQPIISPNMEARQSQQNQNAVNQILPDYLNNSPSEIKLEVEKLIEQTLHQGIEKTIKDAAKSSAFVLDAFHDVLVDKLHEELQKRKLI